VPDDPILHITPRAAWEQARAAGVYRGDTLDAEGFIHCSTVDQVVATANRYFRGRADLVLLVIDPARVGPEIRYEPSPEGERFPHVYGPLDLGAVTRALPLEPGADGAFSLPPELA
jgi:uncharacterized protein (DUF952 family)